EFQAAEKALQEVDSHDTIVSKIDYRAEGPKNYDSILSTTEKIKNTSFEDYILDTINKYKGKSVNDLAEKFGVYGNNLKNFASKVSLKMLGVNTKNAEEFEKANVQVKAIRIEENGTIKQHMSFPAFKFTELVKEEWETSELRELLFET